MPVSAQRFAQVLRLRPESVKDYVDHHLAVWPEVLEALALAHMRNYSIYLRDNVLFSYFEYVGSDYARDMSRMAADASVQRWWSIMEPLQEPWETAAPDEWWASTVEVFHAD